MRLIFESLVTAKEGGGMELQPAKHKTISAMIERTAMSRDIADTSVVYEVAGYLRQSGSPRAADALLGIMMSMASMIEAAKLEREMLAGARP
jgi:hypothetical protein